MIYWLIGQPGCGKTSLAKALQARLIENGIPAIHLDGDDLRKIFGEAYKPINFTEEYIIESTRQLQRFVEHVERQGVSVVVSTVNSFRAVREELKARNDKVTEILVVNNGKHVREEFHRKNFQYPEEEYIEINTNARTVQESCNILFEEIVRKIKPL
jgi:adenylylsulfate kinase-like enzyme